MYTFLKCLFFTIIRLTYPSSDHTLCYSFNLAITSKPEADAGWNNTLWAVRASFKIRHLRRLRLERSRESLSRSWWLA